MKLERRKNLFLLLHPGPGCLFIPKVSNTSGLGNGYPVLGPLSSLSLSHSLNSTHFTLSRQLFCKSATSSLSQFSLKLLLTKGEKERHECK